MSGAEPELVAPMATSRQQAAVDMPLLQLPFDHARSASGTFRTAVQPLALRGSLTDSLRVLSRQEDATLFLTLLAAFQALLARYTGEEVITLGSPHAQPSEPGNGIPIQQREEVLAMCGDLSGDPTFRELLRRVRQLGMEANAHRKPREGSRRGLEWAGGSGSRPFVQVLFSFAKPVAALKSGDDLNHWNAEDAEVQFDLCLEISDRPDGPLGRFAYNRDLFEAETIGRMAVHFQTLIEGIAAAPDQRLSLVPMLTEEEERRILVEWNDTRADHPRESCVHHLVEAQAARTPDSVAVVYQDRRLTYGELNAQANQLAHYLIKRGVGPEVPVGVCLERSLEMAVALLGVLKAGGACMPLDPDYPKERLTFMQEDAKAPVVLTQPGLLPEPEGTETEVIHLAPNWDAIQREEQHNPQSGVKPENLAYVLYTSGSTGKPRGVLLTHGGLVNHNLTAIKLYGLTPKDRVLQFSSTSFDIAIEEIFPTWMSGGSVVLKTEEVSLEVTEFLRWIGEQGITVLDLPTAYWHDLVHQLPDLAEPFPAALRLVVVGGEKASAVTFANWLKVVGNRVRWINTYGPTEASVIATAYEPGPSPGSPDGLSELPIGRPIANTQVYILDSHRRPVPVGVAGELYVGGCGVARGYLNRPELTTERFLPDPFRQEPGARLYRTGDLARYRSDGNIEFRGRSDHQVKIRGFRIELGEIETTLSRHPELREAVVIAWESEPGEKRLVAYLVPAGEARPTVSELRGFLKGKLPEYMVPSAFVMLKAMPLTPNGKVDRRGLPAPEQGNSAPHEASAGPRDAFESRLVEIWEEVLGTRPVGVRENFFELGGHSLLAVRLMHRMEKAFGKRLPIVTLFEAPTIVQLAEIFRRDGWSARWSSLVPIQPGGSRPPFFCVHGFGGTILRFRDLARRLGPDQPVYGLQAQGLDGMHPCLTRVEEMAAHYISEIRALQPEGPYFIGGYSLGGTIAFEMARQLQAQGQTPGLVALLDVVPGRPESKLALIFKLLKLSPQEQFAYLRRKIKKKVKRHFALIGLPQALRNVRAGCARAEDQYQMQVYPGRVTLFLPIEKSLRGFDDPQTAWNQWATGGVEIYRVAGDHGSIVEEPDVRDLAERLGTCLEKAQSSRIADLRLTIAD